MADGLQPASGSVQLLEAAALARSAARACQSTRSTRRTLANSGKPLACARLAQRPPARSPARPRSTSLFIHKYRFHSSICSLLFPQASFAASHRDLLSWGSLKLNHQQALGRRAGSRKIRKRFQLVPATGSGHFRVASSWRRI